MKMVKCNVLLRRKHIRLAEFVIIIKKNRKGRLRAYILTLRIRTSEILPWDRKSYPTHAILHVPRLSRDCDVRATYIGCI